MSERERWIVYPLLFLALGAALRDKLFDHTTTARSIVCQELTVVDQEPVPNRPARVLARIGRLDRAERGSASAGYMIINGQLNVDGIVNAEQFARQGKPLLPGLQAVWPAISLPELMRAIEQAAQRRQADEAAAEEPAAQEPSAQERSAPPPQAPSTTEPLADPAPTR